MEPFVYPAGEAYEKPHHNINLSKYTNYTFENVVSQEHFKVRPSPVEIHTSSKKKVHTLLLDRFHNFVQ